MCYGGSLMRKYIFILYLITAFIIFYLIVYLVTGEVTINVKGSNSNKYIENVNIRIQPDIIGTAGPGTDGAGPYRFKLHIPTKSKISISAGGYKNKNVQLILIPSKEYTIYLDPVNNQ
jgi:hypothetical protein